MKIKVFESKTCCGRAVQFKLDCPSSYNLIQALVEHGFEELKHFTNVGILYVQNKSVIISGALGTDRLQIKCRIANCNLSEIEKLFRDIE
jgi:hypothetical protein